MAVGDDAKPSVLSYIAYGKETTWGTYASASTAVEAISCSFHTERESQKLDTLFGQRGFTKRVTLNKVVEGTLESYLHPVETTLLMVVALGGGVATTAGSTGAYLHSITAGNFDTAPSSVSFNVRKGATSSHVWRYSGGRVDTMKISAAVGEPVKCSFDMVFKDSTLTSDDIRSTLSVSSVLPMTFVNGKFRYSNTEANAATTTSEEAIQSFELEVANNLVKDDNARQLGSELLGVLPATRREISLTITQRFDTTTTYNRFIQATVGAAELYFQGPDSLTSDFFNEITFRMPKLYQNTGDTEADGSSDVLSAEITYDVVVDNPNTTTGKDLGITVRNGVSGY